MMLSFRRGPAGLLWLTTVIFAVVVLQCLLAEVKSEPMACVKRAVQNPACQCKTAEGAVIDFSKLTIATPGGAYSTPTVDYHRYLVNPCQTLTAIDTGAAVVQEDSHTGVPVNYSLGRIGTAIGTYDKVAKWVRFAFSDGSPTTDILGSPRTSDVTFYCGHDTPRLTFQTEQPKLHYQLNLYTNMDCVFTPSPNPTPSSSPITGHSKISIEASISIGSVMLIIVFVSFGIYIGTGVLYNHKKQRTGTELIPNYGFWSSLPGLIKDGARFVGSKASRSNYNSI